MGRVRAGACSASLLGSLTTARCLHPSQPPAASALVRGAGHAPVLCTRLLCSLCLGSNAAAACARVAGQQRRKREPPPLPCFTPSPERSPSSIGPRPPPAVLPLQWLCAPWRL